MLQKAAFIFNFYLFLTIFHITNILFVKCFACSILHGDFSSITNVREYLLLSFDVLNNFVLNTFTTLDSRIEKMLHFYLKILNVVILESQCGFQDLCISVLQNLDAQQRQVSLKTLLQCRFDYSNIQILILHFFSCSLYPVDVSFPIFSDVYRLPWGFILQMLIHV